ncbi:hypothetical protein [Flammeovirga pacifica]|uniref:Uncharacterized protein n=1 Tax=Flammeovirga pacifica TaxID=915059 RepID=A0A1S1YRZ0_FLAPC|nr:hypothetical protein [Flammeovirga pacifica]OHX63796.1 hypothetical protein NH26_24800 [Flammeovirga pacifica]
MKSIFVIFISIVPFFVYAQQKTALDSLLEKYTLQEIKEMSPLEMDFELEKLRGLMRQEQIININKYNVTKLDPFDTLGIEKALKKEVLKINSQIFSYRKEVYPNCYIDVFRSFGIPNVDFYSDPLKRTLEDDDILTYNDGMYDRYLIGDINAVVNQSRREYYFDSSGQLKLIEIFYGRNLNNGKLQEQDLGVDYVHRKLYVNNNELIYVLDSSSFNAYKETEHMSIETVSEDEIYQVSSSETYYYKQNPIIEECKTVYDIRFMTFYHLDTASTETVCHYFDSERTEMDFRNYMIEYKERFDEKYLHPVDSSGFQPYQVFFGDTVSIDLIKEE